MPTKTTSPSRSSRAAATAIISRGEYSISIVDAGGPPLARPESIDETGLAGSGQVRRTVGYAVHVLIEIAPERGGIARDGLPPDVELVVPIVVPLGIRGVGAPRLDDHGVDDQTWNDRPI